MSFILEALRKSEQERQRHQSPGMADLRARNRPSGRPYWLPLVIFLVGINIGLLIFLWLNGTPSTNPPVVSLSATNPAAVIAAPSAAIAEPELQPVEAGAQAAITDSVAAAITPAVVATSAPVVAPTIEIESAVADQQERSLSSELVPQPVRKAEPGTAPAVGSAMPTPQSSPSYGNLPTLTELMLAGTITLVPLRIDMHVFSPQPAERFVFINMNKYREGESLREGPVLTTITQDGVILDYQGRSFLMTRE
jgi:general secretion pathway protein B